MGASVVPGFPAFTNSGAGNGSPIVVTAATAVETFTGSPIAGDTVTLKLLSNGVQLAGTDTIVVTVGATPTPTTVATQVSAAVQADAEWTAILAGSHATANVTYTLVAGQRSNWGKLSIGATIVHQSSSTLAVNSPAKFVPSTGQGVASIVPLKTFPYSASGQGLTFYKGQTSDVPLWLAIELVQAGLAVSI